MINPARIGLYGDFSDFKYNIIIYIIKVRIDTTVDAGDRIGKKKKKKKKKKTLPGEARCEWCHKKRP